ncbi:formate/nitrite transporter family protein [Alkalihalophilus marmarensis]|jgi:nitrite transporter NirC|uniref:Transporter n=1 Tax=Alkalihalophilus marmarensis DSM 21297 TaxID=1188261 RepID=U6SMI2_9BACI|nr:formate/nitrite transporter family protein [Alkalihalophilus marmarensis]ERN52135.1 transporter [Alkalihalophilus marmarensis DSM 21297]MCM3489911.1 formate/nitrite transporter family protein [Alkalihalophilus marmarensis]
MFKDTLETLNGMALSKKKQLEASRFRYLISASLAGAYVGLGIVLIMSVGAPLAEMSMPVTSLVMGLSFGVALTLVIFAGAELFTGNNMVYTVSTLSGHTTWKDTLTNWFWCYLGNFIGAIALCLLILASGIFSGIGGDHLLMTAAANKMNLSTSELFFRGILCNWLVCLAIWTALRTKNDAAKLILIFWMLFAFIASGYEHSIANMTVLGLALVHPHPETITIAGFVHNLIPVTLGNIVGGALFVGALYWMINPLKSKEKADQKEVVVNQKVASIK